MELIRRYFAVMKGQLGGMTISQKLLIGLLALVMVGTIFFTVISSASPQMVPLIPQALSAEEINRVEMALKGKYDYQVVGDRVMVPVERAYAIRGELGAAGALPRNLSSAFTEMIRQASPFTSDAMNARAWNNALQMELTKIIREFPYVEDGTVIVSQGQAPALGRQGQPSTASVFLKMKGEGKLTEDQVLAIVDLVAGSAAGLRRENVSVVVNGQYTYHGPDSGTVMPTNLVAYKKTLEDHFTQQLMRMFAGMGDVKIAVNVVPILSDRTVVDTQVNPQNSVVKVGSERTRETTSSEGGLQGEPGVVTNVGATIAEASGGRGSASSNTETTTENVVKIGDKTVTEVFRPGTEYRELTASLLIPRSYLVSVYQKRTGDDSEPDEAKLQPIIRQQLEAVVALAKNTIGAKSDEQIKADWYDDTILLRTAQTAGMGAMGIAGGSWSSLIGQYARQAVLAVVALGALGMMLMMVKRAAPGAGEGEIDTGLFSGAGTTGSRRKKGANVEQLDAADDVFGEANQGEAVLTGIELDDETLASRKMVDEVSVMIRENPENAVALVKRWMAKGK